MKILIINEPFVPDFCRTQRWAARTRGRVLRAPDWLAYATAVLERDFPEAEVKLFDFPALNWYRDEFVALIKKERPDFVVLDSTTPSIYSDIEYARLVKEHSGAAVIMVGPHISARPEETMEKAAGAVDAGCIGEYDTTVADIVKNWPSLTAVAGIVYRAEGKTVRTAPRALIDDLDSLPFPAWHHLDLKSYFDGGKLFPYIDIISGRGCPNRCIFCLWPQVMHGFAYRFRSPKNVVDEIERDIKLCPDVVKGGEFFFEDDTFTVNRDRAMAICEEILGRGLKITFSVNGRVDCSDPAMLALMKRAGCREILVGFESGVQANLDAMHKGITIEQSRRFMERARAAGLTVHGCFVIGLPGETEATAQQTIDFALGLGLDTLQFSGAVPFPGTAFYDQCSREGWLLTEDWSRWLDAGEQSGVVKYPSISTEAINRYVDQGLKRFYLRPSYMLKFLFKTRGKADLYRKFRGAWNYFRYLLGAR